MQEVLEDSHGDAEVTLVKTNAPTLRIWKSGTGIDVTASIYYRHSLITISRAGRFLDDEALPITAGLGLGALSAMFRIWQSSHTVASLTIFIAVSVAAVAYIAGRIVPGVAASKRDFKGLSFGSLAR